MKLNELKLFSIKILLIGFVPTFIIYKCFSHKFAIWLFTIIALISLISFLSNRVAASIKSCSEKIAHILGNVISYTILTIIFIVIVIPTKFVMILVKRDKLKLRNHNKTTYWVEYDNSKHDYELQY